MPPSQLFLETPLIGTMWKSGKSASTATPTSVVWQQTFQDELMAIRQDPLSDQLQLQSKDIDAIRNDPTSERARIARQKLRMIIVSDDAVWKAVTEEIRRLNLCTNQCIGELLNIDLLERAAVAAVAREDGQRSSPRSACDKMRDYPSKHSNSNSTKIWDGNDEFVSNLRSLLKFCTSVPEKERHLSSGARERVQSGSSSWSLHSTENSPHPHHSRGAEWSNKSARCSDGASKGSDRSLGSALSNKNLRNTSLHDNIIPLPSTKLPLDKRSRPPRVDSANTPGEDRQLSLDLTTADTTEQLLARWSTRDGMHTPNSTTTTKEPFEDFKDKSLQNPRSFDSFDKKTTSSATTTVAEKTMLRSGMGRKNLTRSSTNTPYLSSLHRDESLRTLLSQALSSPEMDGGGDATTKANEMGGSKLCERRFNRGRSRYGAVVGEPLVEDFPRKEASGTLPATTIDGNIAPNDYATLRPTTSGTVSTATSSIGSSSAAATREKCLRHNISGTADKGSCSGVRRNGRIPIKRKPSKRQLAMGSEVIFENFLEKDKEKERKTSCDERQ